MNNKLKLLIASGAVLVSGTAAFFLLKGRTGAKIIKIARSFLGQKEIAGNLGFVNKSFQEAMFTVGKWRSGYEWCASFVRLVWLLILDGKQKYIADRLLSPSTQQTYTGFANDNSGLFSVSQKPKPGSIVIWQSTSKPHKGHAGIYIATIKGYHYFIEGNRNNAVTLMKYQNYRAISNDLHLRGFINWS